MILNKILVKTLILITLFSCSNKTVVPQNRNTQYNDYLIRTQKLNFQIEDTIIETNICIRPDGSFDFIDSREIKSEHEVFSFTKIGDTIINYKEIYTSKSLDFLYLESYFPRLIIHDSSIINHYSFTDEWVYGFSYEMEYSTILKNLNESSIKSVECDTIIRIILPLQEYGPINYHPVTYSIIRLEINNGNGRISHKEGQYDSLANFGLTINRSNVINSKQLSKSNKVIQKLDLDKEYYFTEIGLDISQKYLIEIRFNNEYFVFERGLFNSYHKANQLNDLYYNIVRLRTKYIE